MIARVLALAVGCLAVGLQPLAQSSGTQRLRYADKPWALFVDVPGFVQVEEWASRNGTRRMFRAQNPDTRVIVSAFLERNPALASHAQCREVYWAKALRSPLPKSDLSQSATPDMAFVRWTTREFEGRPVMQRNVHAYLHHDGVCVEIHLSKVEYERDDDRLFDAVLRTVRFGAVR